MNELLSNVEIDTLMEMFREGAELNHVSSFEDLEDIAGGLIGHSTVVTPVDLLKPNRISPEQMQDFERLFGAMAKSIGADMCERLRYEMHCDCVAVEQLRFDNWMQLVGEHAAIYVLDAEPLATPVFFSVTAELLYGCVDRLLGGSGMIVDVPKDFTAAEFAVADAFLGPIFTAIAESMRELAPVQFEIDEHVTNPTLAQVLPSQEVMLCAHVQTGGEFLLGDLRLAFAYSALEPYLHRLGQRPARFKHDGGALRAVLSENVQPVQVRLSVELGRAMLTLGNLLNLRVGDVVPLNQRHDQPLVAPVEGVPKFEGKVGRAGQRLAFQVSSILS